jgi:hypothetical protein
VKKSVFVISLCLGIFASRAFAAEVSIKGNINQRYDTSDNYFLVQSPKGVTVKSTTSGTFNFLAQTSDTSYLLNTNASYFKYLGPGADDAGSLTSGTPASTTFSINHVATELTAFNFVSSWNRADVATTNLAQTGVATGSGSTNTYMVGGGITHDLSRIDTINWSVNATTTSFTDPGSTPYNDYTSAISWNRTLTPTTNWVNSVSFDWFDQDDPAKSQRLFWKLTTGARSQLSPLLSVYGNVGLVFVNSYQKNPTQLATPVIPSTSTPFQPIVGAGTGWVGDVGLSYRLLKTTSISFNAANSIIPTLGGALQQSFSFGGALNHEINSLSNVSFTAQFSMTNASSQASQFAATTGGSSEFLSASVNYGYKLTRDWYSSLSYTYLQRNDSTGTVSANMVFVSLSYDFTLMGNPSAINKATEQRARQRARESIGQVFPGIY